jgi:hypothetical protein
VSALNASNLLSTWEQGTTQHPLERAVRLLHLAWPHKSAVEWANVSVGERDRQLLRLREQLFGPTVEATTRCPKCGNELELTFTARDLESTVVATLSDEPDPGTAGVPPAVNDTGAVVTSRRDACDPRKVVSGEYEIDYRLPTTADLLEIANGPRQSLTALLDRCVVVRHPNGPVQATDLPAAVIEKLSHSMAEADPYAEIQIAMDCAGCSHRWSMVFDVVSYLWGEIEDWAERLLRDVHSLASAYGWSERDIVGMSALRRRLYLELANA